MSFEFRPAIDIHDRHGLFVALVGGTNSGKSFSALRLARGIAGPNGRIAVADTEGGRTLHHAFTLDLAADLAAAVPEHWQPKPQPHGEARKPRKTKAEA